MSGEVSIIITMVAVGVALGTFMFAMFRILDRRIDETNTRIDDRFAESKQHTDERFAEVNRRIDERFTEVNRRIDERFAEVNRRIDETNQRVKILESEFKEFRNDMGEVKGSLNTIHRGLRIEVGQPAE